LELVAAVVLTAVVVVVEVAGAVFELDVVVEV
jgi:hypothetical protein